MTKSSLGLALVLVSMFILNISMVRITFGIRVPTTVATGLKHLEIGFVKYVLLDPKRYFTTFITIYVTVQTTVIPTKYLEIYPFNCRCIS